MGELNELIGTMCALKNVKEAELMGMPKLKKCVLMGGLKNVKSVKMENAGKLESVKGLKELMEEERKRREEAKRKKREEAERKRIEEERKKREEAERKRKEEERKRREEELRKRREEEERRKREVIERMRKAIERKREEERKKEEMSALARTIVSVRNVEDLKNLSCYIGVIAIASHCCNCGELSVLDLSRFVNLRELKVGDECFENVNEVKVIGSSQLERVVIGKYCFTKRKCCFGYDPDRHFYVKNCERVRELKIGCYSFSDYSVCEIENVPSLEEIEMGELNEYSYNFWHASLELKGDSERMK